MLFPIKLEVVGESEAKAKPWIIVLCSKTVKKGVRSFFNQQHIKVEYQPSKSDISLPSFEIFVMNWPSHMMSRKWHEST